MYFFDNEFLGQYLDQGTAVKIFVDNEFFDIADRSDIETSTYGIAYNLNGKPHTFDYREIELIKVGGSTITNDQLQDILSGDSSEDADGDEMDSESAPDDVSDDAMGGDAVIDPVDDADTAGDTPTPPSDTEDAEEPPRESIYYQNLVTDMLFEAKKKKNVVTHNGITTGDIVQNVDMTCEFHGSRGTVTDITLPTGDEGITNVEYRIFNYGYNFKPNQKVTKALSQIQKVEGNV